MGPGDPGAKACGLVIVQVELVNGFGLDAMPALGRRLGGPSRAGFAAPDGQGHPGFGMGLDLRPPMAFFSCFFLTAMATATAPAAPSSTMLFQSIQREGLMLKGAVGASVLELDLAYSGMLLSEKVKFQRYFFWVSAKSGGEKIGKYQFPPASTRTMRLLVPGKR